MVPNRSGLKTVLLGLTVILITFTLFVGLPIVVPSFDYFTCDKYIWLCSERGIEPIKYMTYIWKRYELPGREENLMQGTLIVESLENNDNTVEISGYLMYAEKIEVEHDGLLLPGWEWKGGLTNRPLTIQVRYLYQDMDKTSTDLFQATTGQQGYFSLTVMIPSDADCYDIAVTYTGEVVTPYAKNQPVKIYSESRATYTNCSSSREARDQSDWWIWFVAGIFGIILAIGSYWLLKHRIVFGKRIIRPPSEAVQLKEVVEKKQPETGGNTGLIEIGFSDIAGSMPGVWGRTETLHVTVSLRDKNGVPIRSRQGEVDWGDSEVSQGVSGENGRFSMEHRFTLKGEYSVTARYTDEKTGSSVSSWRTIRIVDYREEMVRLFNEMLKTLTLTEVQITPEMTSREVENLLRANRNDTPADIIDKVIIGFEEANYSNHPVNRESYVNLYKALREVTGNGR